MKFELHITLPEGFDFDEAVPQALEDVVSVLRESPTQRGDFGGIYHPGALVRIGYWQLT